MRTIETIPHSDFLISIMHFNGKYLLRVEAGPYEQIYKLTPEMASSPEAVKAYVDEAFLAGVKNAFDQMHQNLLSSFNKVKGL